MTFFKRFSRPVFYMFSGPPFSAFWSPKGAKRVPIGGNFRSLWGYRWKCENDGFVYTKPSFSWLEVVPRHLLCSTLRAVRSNMLLGATFSQFFVDLEPKRGPRGGPQNNFFGHFFYRASSGGSLGSPGSPKDPRGHQNDTKMAPK